MVSQLMFLYGDHITTWLKAYRCTVSMLHILITAVTVRIIGRIALAHIKVVFYAIILLCFDEVKTICMQT